MSLLGVPNFGVEVAKYLERERKKMASGDETRGSAMSARDVIADIVVAEISSVVNDSRVKVALTENGADAILSALRSAGWAVVPVEPTEGMVERAYTTLSLAANPQMWPSSHSKWNAMWIKTTLEQAIKAAQEDSRE